MLQRGAVRFQPALPDWKVASIDRMGMGVVNKAVLQFERRFWPAEPHFLGNVATRQGGYGTFLNLSPYTGSPILVGFSVGPRASRREAHSDRETASAVLRELSSMFGKVPEPTGIVVTRWGSDPFAAGSYSHIPVGAAAEDYEVLAEPVGKRLFFAGEATNRTYPATVHGAFLSGVREARRIAKL